MTTTFKPGDRVTFRAGMAWLDAIVHLVPTAPGPMAGRVAVKVTARPDMGTVWLHATQITAKGGI